MQVILNKIPSIFTSKRFWIGLIGMAVMQATPDADFEVLQRVAENKDAILLIVLSIITGYSVQDTASAIKGVNKYNKQG